MEPYAQEATLQAVVDIIIMGIALTILTLADFPFGACVAVVTSYFILTLALHYRVLFQAFVDKSKRDYITEVVRIERFAEEFSFAGDRLGHSYIRFFYPKDMQVCKYGLTVTDMQGQKKRLRSVLSLKRLLQFTILDKQQIEYLEVTYLKRSKILIQVSLVENMGEKSNRKIRRVINKAIHSINTSI